jgi:regulator of sigma E protease
MIVLIKAAQLLLSLSILVIIHEFGHFTFAKIFKARVEKFYLFFNPWFSIFKFKKGETTYGLGWLPLGGYVKISGMIDESMDKEQLSKEPQPWEFRSKPAIQRLLIMLGGVLFNVIFAFIVYAMILFAWGESYLATKNVKYGIICDTLALDMGLQHGDKILTVDGKTIEKFSDIAPELLYNDAKSLQVDRDGELVNIPVPSDWVNKYIEKQSFIYYAYPFVADEFPHDSYATQMGVQKGDRIVGINGQDLPYFDLLVLELQNHIGKPITLDIIRNGEKIGIDMVVPESGKIGIYPKAPESFFDFNQVNYGFFESFPAGVKKGVQMIGAYLKDLKLIFTPETKAYKSLGGFIAIGKIFPEKWDWHRFWFMTAFLSIMLAILNLLPIPALDGGHVLFLLVEMITGRKPSDKFLEYAQIVGMLLLLALVLYANGNDIMKLFSR